MSYVSIEEYKAYIWVSTLTPVQEAQINMLLLQTKSMIDNMIWDLTVEEREEKVQFDEVFFERNITKIYTMKKWISWVTSINGVPYTWEFKVDWALKNILYIDKEFDLTWYPFLEIVLTNWFDPIPNDIKMLQCLMIRDMLNQISWWDIVRKKIWDKELWFSSNTSENIQWYIKSIINAYTLIHL
jgi:hypothetical protein